MLCGLSMAKQSAADYERENSLAIARLEERVSVLERAWKPVRMVFFTGLTALIVSSIAAAVGFFTRRP